MRSTLAAPLLWTAFVLLPVDGWGMFDGVPLGVLDVIALAAIWFSWAITRKVHGLPIAVTVIVLKIAAAPLLLEHGFSASYFANATFTPPIERSTDYRGRDVTRVDRRLSFGSTGLPLFFFDDFRFNFYQQGEPRRGELPFSVVWDGYIWVEEGERERSLQLLGSGVQASLEIDGAEVLALPSGGNGLAEAVVLYPKGWRHVVVRISGGQGAARDFAARTGDEVFGDGPVYRAPVSRNAMLADRVLRILSRAIDAVVIVVLGWSALAAARKSAWKALVTAVAVAEAIWFAAPAMNHLLLQPGGDDSLTYQVYARDIVFYGPLMLLGLPAGQGEPFYYQPLYSYFLAIVHLLFGDDLFGLYLIQRLSLAATLVAVCWLTRRVYGRQAATIACVLGIALFYVWVDYAWRDVWAKTLWTEVLFVPLVAAWACSLVALTAKDATLRTAVMSGIAGGLGVLTRSTLLLALVAAPVVVIAARRKARLPLKPVAVMLVVAAAVISLATIRNWIASGRFVPITTSLGINLYLGNSPPSRLPVHDDHAIASLLGADENMKQVIEYASHEPASFARNLFDKLLYTLGIFEPLVPGAGYSPVFILLWALALVGFFAPARDPGWLVPAVIADCLFFAVIAIFPSHFRLIFPGYVLLLPLVAAAAAWPWRTRGTSYTIEG